MMFGWFTARPRRMAKIRVSCGDRGRDGPRHASPAGADCLACLILFALLDVEHSHERFLHPRDFVFC